MGALEAISTSIVKDSNMSDMHFFLYIGEKNTKYERIRVFYKFFESSFVLINGGHMKWKNLVTLTN